jgi:hypothetical protein
MRLYLVDAGIGAVQHATVFIGAQFACDALLQFG